MIQRSNPYTRMLEYASPEDAARGVQQMTRLGWRVVTQSSYTPKKGCLRMLLGGFVFFNPKPKHLVTFEWVPPTPQIPNTRNG